MALAAVKTPAEPVSPAERLAQAQRAEVRPRNRVAELEAALQAAIEAKDYLAADKAQNELGPAREALAIAEGTTKGLAEGLAATEAARAAEQRTIAEAQRADEARRVIGDAIEAEARAIDGIEEALAAMQAALGAAQDAYRRETKAGGERQRVIDARIVLGELEYPGPRAAKPNRASVLRESRPLVRALMQWDGTWNS